MSPPRLPRLPRDHQRGNSLLLALIVMSALATLGSLTVVSVQSSLKTSTNDRAAAIAMYAAESGAAITMNMLRGPASYVDPNGWSQFVLPANIGVVPLGAPLLPSSGAFPGTPNNPFGADQNAWYSVEIFNNRDDPWFARPAQPNDGDGIIIIRSTGRGPQGSVAILEWQVRRTHDPPPPVPPPPPPLPPPPPPPFPAAVAQPLPLPSPAPPGIILMGWHIVL
jgi:hypothetical protein